MIMLLIGLSSILILTEGSPYVSGVISRFERENMRKTTPNFRDEEDNERWWHHESNEQQSGRNNHERNTHRKQNEGERQRYGTNSESHIEFLHEHPSHNFQNRDDSYFFNDDDERPHWV